MQNSTEDNEVVMTFEITRKEMREIEDFIKKHQELHGKSRTAIGGRFTYTFTSTSIGVLHGVQCSCGESTCVNAFDL